MARARGYYSLSLSAGDEAAHLASTLPDLGYRRALLVIEESGFGARVGERFAQSWLRATERQAERFVIRRASDWKRLFERHKIESEEDAEAAIFLAGGGAFVRQARNYIPPRFATFAGSAVYDGAAGTGGVFSRKPAFRRAAVDRRPRFAACRALRQSENARRPHFAAAVLRPRNRRRARRRRRRRMAAKPRRLVVGRRQRALDFALRGGSSADSIAPGCR